MVSIEEDLPKLMVFIGENYYPSAQDGNSQGWLYWQTPL